MTYEVGKGIVMESGEHWLMVEGIRLFPDIDKSTQGLAHGGRRRQWLCMRCEGS